MCVTTQVCATESNVKQDPCILVRREIIQNTETTEHDNQPGSTLDQWLGMLSRYRIRTTFRWTEVKL